LIFGFFPPGTEVPGGFVLEASLPNPFKRGAFSFNSLLSYILIQSNSMRSLSLPLLGMFGGGYYSESL